ncbi:cytochrome d ubiquinol oxidase subunit II [Terrilactibacillus laevilacticus]|uniref:Cytochrome d ubiquinol oxidase subunit II n=1 Tax=Terrilactibacillus laevilacticus TaxID=1380157 RepID=A0ABW5PQ91_9BACI|nr:cytochrome d ubiquinol oxidase subunit II [Terrilactibacillus laevilacticus]
MSESIFIGLWTTMFIYLILASIDFGANFYIFFERVRGKKESVIKTLKGYISPISDVIHICFVLLFAGIVVVIPETSYYLGSSLLFPGILIILLIIFRSFAFAVSQLQAERERLIAALDIMNGIISIIIPVLMSVVLAISEGGFIISDGSKVTLSLTNLVVSPYIWIEVILAGISVIFISSSYMVYYSHKQGMMAAREEMRKFTLLLSVPIVMVSGLVFLGLQGHNPQHFDTLLNYSWMFLISLVSFFLAITLIFKRSNFFLAFLFVIFQYLFAFLGYGLSHLPYILYPYIKLQTTMQLSVNSVFDVILIVFILGVSTIIPLLLLKLRIVVINRKLKEK